MFSNIMHEAPKYETSSNAIYTRTQDHMIKFELSFYLDN